MMSSAQSKRIGIVACGALATELKQALDLNSIVDSEIKFLPAKLHNAPQQIPAAVRDALTELRDTCDQLFVAYADCGTAGALDVVLEEFGATRLEGSHCYAFFAGLDLFEDMHEREIGTFYLTDYLARQFENLVFKPLGLDRHPELRDDYFGHYTRLVYLAQSNDERLDEKAQDAANRLGLRFERVQTGLMPFSTQITTQLQRNSAGITS